MCLIQSLVSKELVRNLPKLKFDQHLCDACKIGKQAHARQKAKNIVSTTRCLELLLMDLFSPSAIRSYGGNRYTLVIVDDYSRLVAQGYNQQEGIDYDETYAPVARLESIRILLAYACALDFKLFQMDVKSAFLNGFINEEVYVAQPSGFIDFEKPDHVYKLKKALYGLKQAPKAWYDRLKAFLIKHEYKMGEKQTALFISTTEAKYVSAGKACQQALWMKQDLIDYDVRLDFVPIMCDNKGAIDLNKNPVQHSRTKHVEIRHHFLRDNVQKGHISIEKVPSVDNIADILMKPLKRESFNYLRLGLGMMEDIP
ncbi:copia protein [Tanacetum coccineum]